MRAIRCGIALEEVGQRSAYSGGADDFLVHIAVTDSSAVRQFVVERMSAHPSVASTRTSLIFEYHRNGLAADFS